MENSGITIYLPLATCFFFVALTICYIIWIISRKPIYYTYEIIVRHFEDGHQEFEPVVFGHGRSFFGLYKWKTAYGVFVHCDDNGNIDYASIEDEDYGNSFYTEERAREAISKALSSEKSSKESRNVVKLYRI